jgi:predicted small secreted protein
MKKSIQFLATFLIATFLLTSCYTYTTVIGRGAQGDNKVVKNNTYFISGLITGKQSDHKEMASGSTNYNVETKHTFIDGLLTAITFGIYAPTTTTVTK